LALRAKTLISDVRSLRRKNEKYIEQHRDWLPDLQQNGPKTCVTWHDPCHLLKGQGIGSEPRKRLRAIPGIEYVEMEGAGTCCGGGGEFQIEHGETSALITKRKIGKIYDTNAAILVTGCPGCAITIGAHLDKTIKVMHPVQLLRRALMD